MAAIEATCDVDFPYRRSQLMEWAEIQYREAYEAILAVQ